MAQEQRCAFQFEGNLSYANKIDAGAGLIIVALQDNDDTDDTTTRKCCWTLSFKDNSKRNPNLRISVKQRHQDLAP